MDTATPALNNDSLYAEELTPDHLAAQAAVPLAAGIVSEVLNLSVRRVTPLVGMGSVNLIFFVDAGKTEIVVRLNKPEDDVAKMHGDYRKEQWCIDRAAAAGIPGPEVLAVGEHSGRAFMLQKRIPGVNGKESGMPPTDLMRTLGRYARLIHSIPVTGFGDLVETFENNAAEKGWLRFVDYNLGELTANDPLLSLGVYTPHQQDAVRQRFLWLRGLPLRVGLNHGDLARRNTIVDEAGRVSLLDWGCAELNIVPHYDLNALLQWYQPDHANLRAFLDGYGISPLEWTTVLTELNAFMLLKAFDLTRWAIDRCPARTTEIASRAERCVTLAGIGKQSTGDELE